ncbi:helix-turn-helix transcriptional regulator [Paenibacillus harenae]|uniref:helix-turn-helix transcriptional regulator n=1 Tax=Paenibacillus harenae TaxID=306543 RepID=UPI0004250D97|nr:AraC family transcriptional regulator [Paenibacillus harenae]
MNQERLSEKEVSGIDTDIYLTADRMPLVRDIGWNQTRSLYTHPDRILDYDVFLFVTKGSMQVIEEETEFVIGAGEHLFLKKGLHHGGLPRTEPGTSWYWIHFKAVADGRVSYKEHLPMLELGTYHPHHYEYRFAMPKHGVSSIHHTLETRLLKLLDDYHLQQEHRMTRISMQAYHLFLDLHQASVKRESREDSAGKKAAVTGRVITYLTEHADRDFDSESLSGQLKLNYSYLSSAFKKSTGQSIVEVHTKLRMNKAIDLMRNTSLNVSEISERLGYKNPYYFSRVFKKVLGEAPSSYRRHFYK